MGYVITLAGRDWPVRYSIRALLYFEQIAGKEFQVRTMTDTYLLMYSFLRASNKDEFTMDFDAFLDAVGDDPRPAMQFNEFFTAESKRTNELGNADSKKKKKGTEKN